MVDADSTLSVSVGEDGVRIVEEFDDYFGSLGDTYSRAGRIKEAMAFYTELHGLMRELDQTADPDDLGPIQFKHTARQALLDLDRRDASDDVR